MTYNMGDNSIKYIGSYIIIAIVLCVKAMLALLLWNYVVLDMFKLEQLNVWQAIMAAICLFLIMLKINIKV